MKLLIRLMLSLLVLNVAAIVRAQQANTFPPATIPNTEVRTIHSTVVGDDYRISIALPVDYYSTKSNYPLLYLTDANLLFATITQMQRLMHRGDEVPEMVIVGIGYASDS